MKCLKNLIVILLFCGSVIGSKAQIVNLGAHGGLNYPNMKVNGSSFSDLKNYGGLTLGLWARVGGMFYVQPEVNYVWSKSAINGAGNTQANINMHHLQLAVSPAIRPLRRKGFQVRLGGTASYSFLLAVNNNSLGINRNDFKTGAFHLGPFLGFDIWRFTLDGRYLWGIGNQSNQSNQSWKSDFAQITLGFRILGKR